MNVLSRILMATRLCLPLGMIAIAYGCSLGNQGAPTPVGPSGPALAVTLSARPTSFARWQFAIVYHGDRLQPDGSPRRTDPSHLGGIDAHAGGRAASVNEVKTGADGKARSRSRRRRQSKTSARL